jgi:hypothetical protein
MRRTLWCVGICVSTASVVAQGQALRGSRSSVDRQYDVAVRHDFTFLETGRDVSRFVEKGLLTPVRGNVDYELEGVSFPYARPAVRTLVERLSAQYRASCGEKLVVTSLTRPAVRQPRNASDLSVHPAGMAVDLRVSRSAKCRSWLERTLLGLERSDVLDATRERTPAHYHVAVFPREYTAYVARLERHATHLASGAAGAAESPGASDEGDRGPSIAQDDGSIDYRVHAGDTLWSIAREHGTTVDELLELNDLRSSRILPGQVLLVPTGL